MFEALTDRLQGIVRGLTGQGRLTPENIRDSLREVRRALLEADVKLVVARDFVGARRARAVGEEVLKSLTPGQQVVGIVRDELESLLGKTPITLAGLAALCPTVVLLAGLQGSGKTTFAGKLARWLAKREQARAAGERRRLPARGDRPARAARGAGRGWHSGARREGTAPVEIAKAALEEARGAGSTSWCSTPPAGSRSTTQLMRELEEVKRASRARTRCCWWWTA